MWLRPLGPIPGKEGGVEAEGKVPQLLDFRLLMEVHYRPKRVCPIPVIGLSSGEGV